MTAPAPSPYPKLAGKPPEQLAEQLKLSLDAKALLEPGQSVEAYVDSLNAAGLYPAAMAVLANALPKRESVWWACMSVRKAGAPKEGTPSLDALLAAENWVRRPTEENRRAAMASTEQLSPDAPSSWAAMAAFWSGDNMAPVGAPTVMPGDELTGRAVAGAIFLAAVQSEPQYAPERYHSFTAIALDIARGGDGRAAMT